MKHKSIRIADIQTSEIKYYDELYEDICFKFCNERNIDCLPSLEDSNTVYVKGEKDKKFKIEEIKENRIVNQFEHIFSPNLLGKFSDNHLLLAHNNSELVGVIHFSDYNKPVVMTYLYSQIASYERILRNHLYVRKFQNSDIIDYFKWKKDKAKRDNDKDFYSRKINKYKRNATEVEKSSPFQSFYLTELIGFLNHKGSKLNHNNVTELRNMIMHARDLVSLEDWNTRDFIYDFESFKKFFGSVTILFADKMRIENRTEFLKSE